MVQMILARREDDTGAQVAGSEVFVFNREFPELLRKYHEEVRAVVEER
jgi:hypothetical protein